MKSLLRAFALAVLVAAGQAHAADKTETFPIDMVMGKADAPLTIIEYASTTCGHCANLHLNTMPKLKAEWVETGKAKVIYRDFPTAPAALSVGAAMIPHCAGPERYFPVLDLIYRQQEKWMRSDNPLAELKRIAALAGMSGEQVDQCLQRRDLAEAIQTRAEAGQKAYGVEATPTLVIGGKAYAGARSYEELDKLLKAAAK